MIPIKYPDSFPDIRKFSGKMHDPTQPLKNPNAKADWSVGDIAWVYMEKKQMLVCGPVTFRMRTGHHRRKRQPPGSIRPEQRTVRIRRGADAGPAVP